SPVAPQDQSRRVHAERTAQSRSATPVLRANTHDSTRSAPPLGVGRPQTSTPPCPRPHLQNQPHPPLPTHQSWTCHHHDNLRRSPLHRPTTHRYRRIIHAPPTTISGLTRRGRGLVLPRPRGEGRGEGSVGGYLAPQGTLLYSVGASAMDSWLAQARRGVVELCVLQLIGQRPRYGYQLVTKLAAWEPLATTEGTLYPLLRRLQREGSISAFWEESQDGPPRKYYQLTDAGVTLLESQLAA